MAETGAPLPYDYDIYVGISHHVTNSFVVCLRCSDLSWREMLLETFYTRILGAHYIQCLKPWEAHRTTGRIYSHPNLTCNEVLINPEILHDYRPSESDIALDISRDGKSFVSDHIPAFQPPALATHGEHDHHLSFIVEIVMPTALPKCLASGDVHSTCNEQRETSVVNFRRVGQRLLASLGPGQTLPSPRVSNIQQLLAQPGMLLVDKTFAVSVIDHCDPGKIIILRRPRGYGMKTFLSMVSQVYDDLSSPTLIEALYPEYEDTFFSPTHPVLHLDFSRVSADASTIAESLHEYINSQIRRLILTYEDLFGFEDVESFMKSTPGSTLTLATASFCSPPLLLIENYDSPVLRARQSDRAAVMSHMDRELFAAVSMSHVQGDYVRTILTSEVVTDAYTGIHLDRLERFSIDLTHDAAMQEVFGFTEKEVRALDGVLEGKNPAAGDVIQDLHERGIESCNFNTSSKSRYKFSGSTDAVYPMQEVLDLLAQRVGKPNRQ
ncbi:hypothetical protein BDZ89DRAFT_1076289 [Hymenopellis radicata]|nr:hypothetical protein BDZ89DRAFT_1076289 [Hymenopellis radicata]